MTNRSYNQFCPLARGLDVIGDRWTLLIVRELLVGPRRFTDLKDELPAMGENLLAARLKELAQHRLVEQRELPPPAARRVYALTSAGYVLRPAVRELVRFGARYFDSARERDFQPTHGALSAFILLLRQPVQPRALINVSIAGSRATLRVEGGEWVCSPGGTPDPDGFLEVDLEGLGVLLTGRAGPAAAVAARLLREGPPGLAEELLLPVA